LDSFIAIKVKPMKTISTYQIYLRVFFINLIFFYNINLVAQSRILLYTDAGRNNVSRGNFIKYATIGYYNIGKNKVETGFQTDLKNGNKNGFSGYVIDISRELMIKGIPIELKGLFIRTTPSAILYETNWGPLLKLRHNHFEIEVGTNFRTYSINNQAISEYQINSNATKVHEIYNLMYSFSYNLKPTDDHWNVGIVVTNIDHFVINQETNPVFNLNGLYKLSTPVCLFAQAWYKCAGVTNLELNHFGFFFRTGIIWNIN
jgi:hypothetical protein